MAALILTEQEKACKSLTEWDDEALGRAVKKCMSTLIFGDGEDGERRATYVMTCAHLICRFAEECNATTSIINIEGLSFAGEMSGDWIVTAVKRKAR